MRLMNSKHRLRRQRLSFFRFPYSNSDQGPCGWQWRLWIWATSSSEQAVISDRRRRTRWTSLDEARYGGFGFLHRRRGASCCKWARYAVIQEMVGFSDSSGYGIHYPIRHGQVENWVSLDDLIQELIKLTFAGSYGKILVELHIQVSSS